MYAQIYAFIIFLALPILIIYQRKLPMWDDAILYKYSLSFGSNFWQFNLAGMYNDLSLIYKAPIVCLLSVPWGQFISNIETFNLILPSLVFLNILTLLLSIYILSRLNIPLILSAICVSAISFSPAMKFYSGILIPDNLNVFAVTLLFLLTIYEYYSVNKINIHSRGLLLGYAFFVGILSKFSFIFFFILLFSAILCKFHKNKYKGLLSYLFSASIFVLPSLIIFFIGFNAQYTHASAMMTSTVRDIFKNNGLVHIVTLIKTYYLIPFITSVLFSLLFAIFWGVQKYLFKKQLFKFYRIKSIHIYSYLVIVLFFIVALGSRNVEPFYIAPALISMPFISLTLFSRQVESCYIQTKHIIIALLCLTIPIISISENYSFDNIKNQKQLFIDLQNKGYSSAIYGSDGSDYNYGTAILANYVEPRTNIAVSTIGFCIHQNNTFETCLSRLVTNDVIIFEYPIIINTFTNSHTDKYYEKLNSNTSYKKKIMDHTHIFIKNK